jgi:hypothetical protein
MFFGGEERRAKKEPKGSPEAQRASLADRVQARIIKSTYQRNCRIGSEKYAIVRVFFGEIPVTVIRIEILLEIYVVVKLLVF